MNGEQKNQKIPIKKLNLIQKDTTATVAPLSYESSDENEEPEDTIKVGREFQAAIPDFIPVEERELELLPERETMMWGSSESIDEEKLEQYLTTAKEQYGYTLEQALGMLFFHKHDIDQAAADLPNFRPTQTVWSDEEKVLFEQAFQFHGKNFNKIKQMFPGKPIGKLVQFYYLWKKQRGKISVMDKQTKKRADTQARCTKDPAHHNSGSNTDSDSDERKWVIPRGIRRRASPTEQQTNKDHNEGEEKDGTKVQMKHVCSKCKAPCTHLYKMDTIDACRACVLRWRKTRNLREMKEVTENGRETNLELPGIREIPSKRMYIDQKDLDALTNEDDSKADLELIKMDQQLGHLKRIVQFNKQYLEEDRITQHPSPIDTNPSGIITPTWADEELQLAVAGIRLHGLDFQTIAETIGTKTAEHVSSFFTAYNKRFELDKLLKLCKKNYDQINSNQDCDAKSAMNGGCSVVEKMQEVM